MRLRASLKDSDTNYIRKPTWRKVKCGDRGQRSRRAMIPLEHTLFEVESAPLLGYDLNTTLAGVQKHPFL